MAKDPHAHAEKIYHALLDLFEELVAVYTDMTSDDDENDVAERMSDIIDEIVQEAGERGLDENGADKLFHAIAAYAQKASEM